MIAFWTVIGLCLGSFANVLIHRLPSGKSPLGPRSACPHCRRPIAFYDNVPLLSFLLLQGRCRHCRKPISWRYPVVEALAGIVIGALAWRWPGENAWIALTACAATALIAVAFIDWNTLLIPDILSLGLVAGGILSSPFNVLYSGGAFWRLGQSLLGAAVGFLICWAVAALGEKTFKKEAMGGGDVKLLAAVGAWSGALGAFDCLVSASLLGSIYGGGLLLRRKIRRQDPIPFGPFLSAGALFNFFYLLPFGFPFNLF